MVFQEQIARAVTKAFADLFGTVESLPDIQVQRTRKDFEGEFTVVIFPLLGYTKLSPEESGRRIGAFLKKEMDEILDYNVVKGFLNLSVQPKWWGEVLKSTLTEINYGDSPVLKGHEQMVEFSSPNTNKPLHLGHLRNNFLGFSLSRILEACGWKVIKTQIINDRGVHICKSMLAWKLWGNGETPESSGLKGDHLAGKYYVLFEQHYRAEVLQLVKEGKTRDEAESQAPLMIQVRGMLQKWESADPETIELWKKMNSWVYDGFESTYKRMGVSFDSYYYESDTYTYGRELILEHLKKGTFFQKEDGSIWVDLTAEGLDEKLLMRKDGTSVYMTQDVGTAVQRFEQNPGLKGLTYVVGNEQDYHFKALFHILKKMGYEWANECFHLSYGMVDLPSGKMKSREGTVVDADELMHEMVENARLTAEELGKLEDYSEDEKNTMYEKVGLGALKYFILKVDPRKRMLFDPKESIDFNGNTGPFIQYTYARIQSVLKKAAELNYHSAVNAEPTKAEIEMINNMYEFPSVVRAAAQELNPSLIANFAYEMVKSFNHFYQTTPILKAEDEAVIQLRLAISEMTGRIVEKSMFLLAIEVPDRM